MNPEEAVLDYLVTNPNSSLAKISASLPLIPKLNLSNAVRKLIQNGQVTRDTQSNDEHKVIPVYSRV